MLTIARGNAACSEFNPKVEIRRAMLLVMMTSGWQDPEVHLDSSKKAGCVSPAFMPCLGQFMAL